MFKSLFSNPVDLRTTAIWCGWGLMIVRMIPILRNLMDGTYDRLWTAVIQVFLNVVLLIVLFKMPRTESESDSRSS